MLPDERTPSRRDFLTTSARALIALGIVPRVSGRAAHDIVIRNGTVFDGMGSAGLESDVAIAAGKISALGSRIAERGIEEIDARGLAVAPGFIDIHSHGDGSMWEDPRVESLVRQGVTTIVVGQDGSSRAPSRLGGSSGAAGAGDSDRSYESFDALFKAIDTLSPSVNVASMVGTGTLRGLAVGDTDRKATGEEMARMVAAVEQALAQGACGVSSGLEYTPGAFAPLEELIALSKPLAAKRLPYATHMRNEDDRLLEAVDEAIAVARGAGCPLEISHLKAEGPRNWGKLDQVFARIENARQAGVVVAFDRYPYLAYQTGLTNLFPVWSRDGGTDAFLARLHDASVAPRIKQETLAKVEMIGGWNNVMVVGIRAEADKAADGRRLDEYAKSSGMDPYDVAVAMLERGHGNVGMVGFAMSEANLERVLAHPLATVCSDGGAFAIDGPTHRGTPHPRGLGTFPRVLSRYVRDTRTLTLAQAIHKMTGLSASRVHLRDRGRLAVGAAADVVVFDPATIEDKATYQEPFRYPVGIEVVVVNGGISLRLGHRVRTGRGRAHRAG